MSADRKVDAGAAWEYCSLSRGMMVGAPIVLSHYKSDGPENRQLDPKATLPWNDLAGENDDVWGRTVARLGSVGWEMVGPVVLPLDDGSRLVLHFKRAITRGSGEGKVWER